MRVLWNINIPLPIIAKQLRLDEPVIGGWLVGLYNEIIMHHDIDLGICFPISSNALIHGQIDRITYFGIPMKKRHQTRIDASLRNDFLHVMELFKPDIIHAFGTEFPHTYAFIQAFNQPKRTVINMQGIVHEIAKQYTIGLPFWVKHRYTLRDIIRRNNIVGSQRQFTIKSQYEMLSIQHAAHIIGRTDFDRAYVKSVAPDCHYVSINETLRHVFYDHRWDIQHIEKYSLLMSQSNYPIKGLHMILKDIEFLSKTYPTLKLYVTGEPPYRDRHLVDRIKISSYGLYIKSLIKRYHLKENVVFLGNLNEAAMCDRFLKTHIFISPSLIENESNSLSEAKMLGVPAVASYVGGVTNRIDHGQDGYLFPLQETRMFSYYVRQIFESDDLAKLFSERSHQHALTLFDSKKNYQNVINLYRNIIEND